MEQDNICFLLSALDVRVEGRMSFISVISRHSKYILVIVNRKPPRFLTGNIPRKSSNIEPENIRA